MRNTLTILIASLSFVGLAHAEFSKGTKATIPINTPLCSLLSVDLQVSMLDAGIQKAAKGCSLNATPQEALVLMSYEPKMGRKYSKWYLVDSKLEVFIPDSAVN